MSDQKKTRKMTAKGFLHKTTTKAANSAAAFIAQYREYLTTGELAPKTSHIINQVDLGQLLPTPALKEIQNAVMAHIIESDTKKQEQAELAAQEPKTSKSWIATVYNAEGVVQSRIKDNGEEEDLIKGFDLSSDADRWCDRRLFDGASDWHAEVVNASLNLITRIERNDSIARILKKKKGPTMYVKGKSTKSLGFGVKAKQTRVTFSRA